MRGSKKSKGRRGKKEKSAKKKATKNNGLEGSSLKEMAQISSGETASEVTVAAAALKWEKLSPGEFETLQEYIQCK